MTDVFFYKKFKKFYSIDLKNKAKIKVKKKRYSKNLNQEELESLFIYIYSKKKEENEERNSMGLKGHHIHTGCSLNLIRCADFSSLKSRLEIIKYGHRRVFAHALSSHR